MHIRVHSQLHNFIPNSPFKDYYLLRLFVWHPIYSSDLFRVTYRNQRYLHSTIQHLHLIHISETSTTFSHNPHPKTPPVSKTGRLCPNLTIWSPEQYLVLPVLLMHTTWTHLHKALCYTIHIAGRRRITHGHSHIAIFCSPFRFCWSFCTRGFAVVSFVQVKRGRSDLDMAL